MDKSKPKLAIIKRHKFYPDSAFCPTCESFVGAFVDKKEKCINCGQTLKYQESENGQKTKALQGLKCCAEFLCGECPYAEYQHIEYKLQCIHKLHMDLAEVLKINKGEI